jgi:hypothetical protein
MSVSDGLMVVAALAMMVSAVMDASEDVSPELWRRYCGSRSRGSVRKERRSTRFLSPLSSRSRWSSC